MNSVLFVSLTFLNAVQEIPVKQITT